jgi:hypothetical protein
MIEEFYSYRGRRHRLRRDPLMLLNIVDSSEKLTNDFYSRQRLSIIKINCLIICFIFNEIFYQSDLRREPTSLRNKRLPNDAFDLNEIFFLI